LPESFQIFPNIFELGGGGSAPDPLSPTQWHN